MPELYLEDFKPGQRFVSRTLVVDADQVKAFATEYDPQPFHLDEDAARRSVFRKLAASGWHTAAMTMRLLVESELSVPGGLIGVGGEITWPRPTYPGDALSVESEVIEVRPSRSKPDRGLVTIRTHTLNQHAEPVQIAIMKLVVPRRGQPSPAAKAGR